MKENIVQKLTSKDDKYACAYTDRIVAESHDTDEWYGWGVVQNICEEDKGCKLIWN